MKPGVIIQARLGSTRLPEKVLKPILGKPILRHVLERVLKADLFTVLAVPMADSERLGEFAAPGTGIFLFSGAENDVLSRYYFAARRYDLDPVVRVTSDCPMIDGAVIAHALTRWKTLDVDYLSNCHPVFTMPAGFNVEIFSFDALRDAHFRAEGSYYREHVTPFMYRPGGSSWIGSFPYGPVRDGISLSVDTQDDLDRVTAIFEHFQHSRFSYLDVTRYLDAIESNRT